MKLQSTMTEEKITDLALLSIEREFLTSIERFAEVDQGRILRFK